MLKALFGKLLRSGPASPPRALAPWKNGTVLRTLSGAQILALVELDNSDTVVASGRQILAMNSLLNRRLAREADTEERCFSITDKGRRAIDELRSQIVKHSPNDLGRS